MRQRLSLVTLTLPCSVVALLLAGTGPVLAGAHDGAGGKPKTPPTPDAFYEHTGFEGREQVLTDAVVKAIREAKPNNGETLNFTAEQQKMLGLAVAKAIKTISNDTPYQHEPNDALVKALLTNIQFAKDNDMMEEMINHEVKTQSFLLQRVGNMISNGGSLELATIALTERTACFYQLVQNYERTGTTMRWKAPFGNVLAASSRIGQHNLTEQEIHEIYTIPIMKKQAAVMGMEVDISPWQADGWVTMTVKAPEKVAAR
jgi:hypothetical protein